MDNRYAPAHGLLGLIYMDIGDQREAEASFGRALRLEPENADILNNFGWFLCQTGRERESIDCFQRAAANRLYATPGLAMRNAGGCLIRINDLDGAERALRRALELDASDSLTKFELARLSGANFRDGFLDIIGRVREEVNRSGVPLLGVGVGVSGVINPEKGLIHYSIPMQMDGPFDFHYQIARDYDLPLFLENDANACA